MAATLMAGPAGAATAARQVHHRPNGAATDTQLSLKVDGSRTTNTVAFDKEPTVEMDFNVSNDGSVGITGTFTVFAADEDGNVIGTACDNVPMHGFSEGSCTMPDGKLAPGTYKIIAQYNGDDNNNASASPAPKLIVTKEPTSAALATVAQIAFGQESDEEFAVTPAPRTSGTPTGNFEVLSTDGATTFCLGPLANGVGKCSLLSTKLPPGTYDFTGFYDGDSTFAGSVSDSKTITVTPGNVTTTLTLSPPRIGFGQQQTEQMTVHVAPVGDGTPTGQVSIRAGGTTLCTVPLASGTATCGLGIGQLPIGSYQLTAFYSGDSNFAGSTSAQKVLTVTGKSVATASLTLSAARVTFGHEQAERLTAKVTGQVSGIPPTGKVTVKAGSAAVCTITLASGQGSCTLGATRLRPGTYHLTVSYGGDVTYGSATSGSKTLTVAQSTTTTLKLSAARVRSGHEQSEHLSVQVKPQLSGTPTGKVTIKAGPVKLCVITLKSGKGTCALKARQLRAGTYHLTAGYAAAALFAGSTSAKKTLTVTK
jgi:hypothetical protein